MVVAFYGVFSGMVEIYIYHREFALKGYIAQQFTGYYLYAAEGVGCSVRIRPGYSLLAGIVVLPAAKLHLAIEYELAR